MLQSEFLIFVLIIIHSTEFKRLQIISMQTEYSFVAILGQFLLCDQYVILQVFQVKYIQG